MEQVSINVRTAATADAVAIARLSAELGYMVSEAETLQYIAQISAGDKDIVYVAEQDGAVIAWMQITFAVRIECAPFCEIVGLVVSEQCRGMGIGHELIRYAQEWTAQRCHLLKVRTNILREKTHRFYEHAGFTEVKQQKIYEMKI